MLSLCVQLGPWNPACFRSFTDLKAGQWIGDMYAPENATTHSRYVPPANCALQDDPAVRDGPDIAAVRRSLAGKKLFFAGDAQTLWFVKALLYTLRFARWPGEYRFRVPHSPFTYDFEHWGFHFARLTYDLGPENFRCDCFQ